jgi:SAM-dependent methyltransferase
MLARRPAYAHAVTANVRQSEAWNGNEGLAWAAHQDRHDRALRRFNAALASAAEIGDTEAVLDVGCGCGQSTRDAARAASRGRAVGIDLSAPMLERARGRAVEEGLTNVEFVQADAQVHDFGADRFDVVTSRFGAMFFSDPAAAFANIAGALHPGARVVLAAWMPLDQNEWLWAVRAALAMGRELPSPPVGAPGPFGLADPASVRALLEAAGYAGVDFAECRSVMEVGADPDDAFAFVSALPPVRGMVEGLDAAGTEQAFNRLRTMLREHATPDGVLLGASAWMITARRP